MKARLELTRSEMSRCNKIHPTQRDSCINIDRDGGEILITGTEVHNTTRALPVPGAGGPSYPCPLMELLLVS